MQIGIVGLGLMGGSIAKALRQNTNHRIIGIDKNDDVLASALQSGVIDDVQGLEGCDVVFVCLYPRDAVAYILNQSFRAGAVVTDICGVKRFTHRCMSQALHEKGIRYVGSHPMAGKEISGFGASEAGLFKGASYIITKDTFTDEHAVDILGVLAAEMGFARVTVSTPEEHDRVIAFTSQLAHAVSNSYVKNPEAGQRGFSANSFEDLTRVAKLDATMWAELFMENADYLCADIDDIIGHLTELKDAMEERDEELLRALLRRGSEIKEGLIKNRESTTPLQPTGYVAYKKNAQDEIELL